MSRLIVVFIWVFPWVKFLWALEMGDIDVAFAAQSNIENFEDIDVL